MTILFTILWLLLCIVLQGLLFNHLSLLGGVALVYLIVLLKVPVLWNHSLQILIGFVTGLAVDVFCNTPGMHALTATTMMAFRRPALINNFFDNKEDIKEGFLGMNSLEPSRYATYSAIFVTGYSLLLYFVESFTLFNFQMLLTKIIIGSLLTLAFAMAVELASLKK